MHNTVKMICFVSSETFILEIGLPQEKTWQLEFTLLVLVASHAPIKL